MNPKHLIPTWRTRYTMVRALMPSLAPEPAPIGLHIGCGEGDYDRLLAPFAQRLVACDINPDDVSFAARVNADLRGVEYSVEDATSLTLADGSVDWVVSIETVEHVSDRRLMLREIHRVLRSGGVAVLTGPHHHFPLNYDPLNLVLRRTGRTLPVGAYCFGHEQLLEPARFEGYARDAGLEVSSRTLLSGALSAAAESYWISLVQMMLKPNPHNRPQTRASPLVRPGREEPALATVVDGLVSLDRRLFGGSRWSVGLA